MVEANEPQQIRQIRALLADLPDQLAPWIAALSDADIDAWFQREARARKKAQRDNMAAPSGSVAEQTTTAARAQIAVRFAEMLYGVKGLREKGAQQILPY